MNKIFVIVQIEVIEKDDLYFNVFGWTVNEEEAKEFCDVQNLYSQGDADIELDDVSDGLFYEYREIENINTLSDERILH